MELKPGSDAAIVEGCTCPVLDNNNGQGREIYGEIHYWMNIECPIHGSKEEEES